MAYLASISFRFGLAFGGAYAEYIAVAEGMLTKKPAGVSWVQAACVPFLSSAVLRQSKSLR